MSDYYNNTEEQQFNEAKNWLKQNGGPIVAVIFIASASWFGWTYWQKHQLETAQSTSASYQSVMESYLQDSSKNAPLVEKFITDNKGSSYAVFAQLEQAKQAVEKSDFTTAKTLLQQALQNTADSTLQDVIRFRLTTLDYQLQQYDDALATLGQIKDPAWEQRKQTLLGDLLAAKGDKAAAKTAYEAAKAKASEQDKVLIDVRLNNL